MTIRWEATIDDALVFYQYYTETDPEVKRVIRIRQIFIPALALVFLLIVGKLNLLFLWMPLSAVWIGFMPTWVRSRMVDDASKAYQKPKNMKMFGARELTLDSDGFRLKTDICDTLYKWKVVTGVTNMLDYCFVDIAEREILVIPKGRLTDEEVAEFKRILETYIDPKLIKTLKKK